MPLDRRILALTKALCSEQRIDYEIMPSGAGHDAMQMAKITPAGMIFVPSVGNFRQGMLVSVPLHLDTLPGRPTPADLEAALAAHFAGSELVKVIPSSDSSIKSGRLEPQALNETDRLELRVFGNEARSQAVLVARLDNLGKGASGAAVQNIQLMLGVTG